MLLLTRRRNAKTLLVAAGAVVSLFIFYNLSRNQRPEVPLEKVYPDIRFAGTGSQRSPSGIPRIIHQTWKSDAIPTMLSGWVRSWRTQHPNWEYWFWTDADIRRLVDISYPGVKNLFLSYPENGYRADAFRYLVLYMHGGVYADLDMECLHSLDPVTTAHDCILSQEPEEHAHFLAPVGIPLVSNALIACRPGHPFFGDVIAHLPSYAGWINWADILHATGPYMLTKAYHGLSNKPHLASPELFQPLVDSSMLDMMRQNCLPGSRQGSGSRTWSDTWVHNQRRMCVAIRGRSLTDRAPSNAFTVHHFTHTWAGRKYDPKGVFNSPDTVKVMTLLGKGSSPVT